MRPPWRCSDRRERRRRAGSGRRRLTACRKRLPRPEDRSTSRGVADARSSDLWARSACRLVCRRAALALLPRSRGSGLASRAAAVNRARAACSGSAVRWMLAHRLGPGGRDAGRGLGDDGRARPGRASTPEPDADPCSPYAFAAAVLGGSRQPGRRGGRGRLHPRRRRSACIRTTCRRGSATESAAVVALAVMLASCSSGPAGLVRPGRR